MHNANGGDARYPRKRGGTNGIWRQPAGRIEVWRVMRIADTVGDLLGDGRGIESGKPGENRSPSFCPAASSL